MPYPKTEWIAELVEGDDLVSTLDVLGRAGWVVHSIVWNVKEKKYCVIGNRVPLPLP
jgi:hypothetical protein